MSLTLADGLPVEVAGRSANWRHSSTKSLSVADGLPVKVTDGPTKQWNTNLRIKAALSKQERQAAEKRRAKQAKSLQRTQDRLDKEDKEYLAIQNKDFEEAKTQYEARRAATAQLGKNANRLLAVQMSRDSTPAYLQVTEAAGRKMRYKSLSYTAQPPERFHVPTGYDGRVPLPNMDNDNLAATVYSDKLKWTASASSDVREAFTSNMHHKPRPSPFRVFSESRKDISKDLLAKVSDHERCCKTCRTKCKQSKKNTKIGKKLVAVRKAHKSCWKNMAELTTTKNELSAAYAPLPPRNRKLKLAHERLVQQYDDAIKNIARMRALQKEHKEVCKPKMNELIDETNKVKLEIAQTKAAIKETKVLYDKQVSREETTSVENKTASTEQQALLDDMQASIDRTVETCINYSPSIGLQLIELPGDGIAIKLAPEDLPAYQCGLRQFDMILECNGSRVYSKSDFKKAVADCCAGDRVSVLVRRKKGNTAISLIVGATGATVQAVHRNNKLADWYTKKTWREKAVKFGDVLEKASSKQPLSPKTKDSYDGSPRQNPLADLGAFRPDLSSVLTFDLA